MEPPTQRAWQLMDTIGPLFSHFGLKNWDLCLARDAVIACPRSLWLTGKGRRVGGARRSRRDAAHVGELGQPNWRACTCRTMAMPGGSATPFRSLVRSRSDVAPAQRTRFGSHARARSPTATVWPTEARRIGVAQC